MFSHPLRLAKTYSVPFVVRIYSLSGRVVWGGGSESAMKF